MSTEQIDLSKLKIRRENGVSPETPSGSRSRLWVLLYIAGALFLVLSAFFFVMNYLRAEQEVEVTTVFRSSPAQANTLLTASGYVVAQRKAAVASKATGRLVYLGFKEGDQVKKGQVIARIESADVEAALEQARADLAVAKAELVDAQQSFERAKTLIERQLISQAEYDATRARYERVVASIASREAAVRAAEVQVENTNIRAPFDGTILTKNADVGEVVAPFGAGASSKVAVVTIADMGSLEVEADVSESNIHRISVAQPCEITLDAYPDRRYRGVVDKIVPTADRAKATVMTKIRFLERDERVLPEMSAKVSFLSQAVPESVDITPKITVDLNVMTTRNGMKVVFVVNDKTVTERRVTTGGMTGSLVEVTSGLSPGERVVLRPRDDLESGSRIRIKQE